MSAASPASCNVCATPAKDGAQFCVGCGNPLDAPVIVDSSEETQRCGNCGASVSGGERFCTKCGAELAPDTASPAESAYEILDALEAILAPVSPLVLLERPGSKQARRCEVVSGPDGHLLDVDLGRVAAFLDEALTWDGYLLAVLRHGEIAAPCIWHVLNGELFGLDAEHAASLLNYLDGLHPEHWAGDEPGSVISAPSLRLDNN